MNLFKTMAHNKNKLLCEGVCLNVHPCSIGPNSEIVRELPTSSNGNTCLPSLAGAGLEDSQRIPSLGMSDSKLKIAEIRLGQIVVDLSVLQAVNKWLRLNGFNTTTPGEDYISLYWDEDGEFPTSCNNLLPLGRLENMMSGTFLPPPIMLEEIRHNGKTAYTYGNGRHRHARLLIQNHCNPSALLSNAADYVVEKNPGPPKRQVRRGPLAEGNGGPRAGQARHGRDLRQQIDRAEDAFRRTEWYLAAVKAGFKNQPALQRFNETVATFRDQIDPAKTPVCLECGESNLTLCDHFVISRGADVVDNALIIPAGVNMSTRYDWVNKIRRIFVWPTYNSNLDINHSIYGFDNQTIGDTLLWPDLLAYIRLNLHTTYKRNGVFDRAAKLAHSQKLALRFLDERKVTLEDRTRPHFVAVFKNTVKKACDQRDDSMLLQDTPEVHNYFWAAPSRILRNKWTLFTVAAVMSPKITSKLLSASMRINMYIMKQQTKALLPVLETGSELSLKYAVTTLMNVSNALLSGIWNGIFQPSLTGLKQLSCKTVLTTPMTVCIKDTLRKHQVPVAVLCGGMLSVVSYKIYQKRYVLNWPPSMGTTS